MKKGFTLIELLAVIVILAIIALIATPIILNIIEDSKKQSIISSANIYVDGLSKYIVSRNMLGEFNPSSCTITNGNISCDGTQFDYTVDGDKPTSGAITFTNGIISGYRLCISDYKVTKSGNNVTTTKDSSCEASEGSIIIYTSQTPSNDTHKGIVYLDPTDLTTVCTASDAVANLNDKVANEYSGTGPKATGVTSGCMKFYIYDDEGSDYKMILDHNTSGNVNWISDADYQTAGGTEQHARSAAGPITVTARLIEDTAGWEGNPRLITADEIAHIVGADEALGWDSTDSNSDWFFFDGTGTTYEEWQNWDDDFETISNAENPSRYAWLFDNIWECIDSGCNVEDSNSYSYPTNDSSTLRTIDGYWTATPRLNSIYNVWHVSLALSYGVVSDTHLGVRPVITLSKSLFSSTRVAHQELFPYPQQLMQ